MTRFGTFTQEVQVFLSLLKEKDQQILLMLHDGWYQAKIAEKLKIDQAYVSRFVKN